jgi:hypothetical protein
MINGNDLGTDINEAIENLSSEEKQDLELAWQTIANEIANSVNPFLISLPVLEDWTTVLVFQNNWINYDTNIHEPVGFYKDPYNRVFLRGTVKDGTSNGIFYLPIGYRPTKQERFSVSESSLFGEITIATTGLVSRTDGGNSRLHLYGISFRI